MALLERRAGPVVLAWERFQATHGRMPNLKDPADGRLLGRLLDSTGGGGITWEAIGAAAEATTEVAHLSEAAAATMAALHDAWQGRDGDRLLDWVGVDAETFERAVREALAA